jgi:predicted nucleic acid-binding protein
MARPAKKSEAPALRLILDSGAVIALARRDVRARAALAAAWEAGAEVVLPAVVVAETVRGNGPRDAGVNRIVAAVGDVTNLDEATARLAGSLLAQAASNATVDALVVAEAVAGGGGVVLTGDADDIERLAGPHDHVLVQPL